MSAVRVLGLGCCAALCLWALGVSEVLSVCAYGGGTLDTWGSWCAPCQHHAAGLCSGQDSAVISTLSLLAAQLQIPLFSSIPLAALGLPSLNRHFSWMQLGNIKPQSVALAPDKFLWVFSHIILRTACRARWESSPLPTACLSSWLGSIWYSGIMHWP